MCIFFSLTLKLTWFHKPTDTRLLHSFFPSHFLFSSHWCTFSHTRTPSSFYVHTCTRVPTPSVTPSVSDGGVMAPRPVLTLGLFSCLLPLPLFLRRISKSSHTHFFPMSSPSFSFCGFLPYSLVRVVVLRTSHLRRPTSLPRLSPLTRSPSVRPHTRTSTRRRGRPDTLCLRPVHGPTDTHPCTYT